jgi:hypothetical protein
MRGGDDDKRNHMTVVENIYSDDLAEALISQAEQKAKLRSRTRLMLSFMAALSAVIGVVSAGVVLSSVVDITDSSPVFFAAFVLGIFGWTAAIFLKFLGDTAQEKTELVREMYHLDDEKIRLVREWIAFEGLSRQLILSDKRSNAQLNLTEIIQGLSDKGVVGEIDRGILLAALRSRNEIVHTGQSGLSRSEEGLLQERLSSINKILFGLLNGAAR